MVVAVAVGKEGINSLLIASQVALSIVLPFVVFPLIWLTSSKDVMKVRKPRAPCTKEPTIDTEKKGLEEHVVSINETHWYPGCVEIQSPPPSEGSLVVQEERQTEVTQEEIPCEEPGEDVFIDYSSGWFVTSLVSLIFVIVLVANVYVIVVLALGDA